MREKKVFILQLTFSQIDFFQPRPVEVGRKRLEVGRRQKKKSSLEFFPLKEIESLFFAPERDEAQYRIFLLLWQQPFLALSEAGKDLFCTL